MPTSTGTALASIPVHRKSVARVALFDLPAASAQLVTECFRQSGIETVLIPREQADALHRGKVDACDAKRSRPAGCPSENEPAASSSWREDLRPMPGSSFMGWAGARRMQCVI